MKLSKRAMAIAKDMLNSMGENHRTIGGMLYSAACDLEAAEQSVQDNVYWVERYLADVRRAVADDRDYSNGTTSAWEGLHQANEARAQIIKRVADLMTVARAVCVIKDPVTDA